jgi:signal transduction histidine kinase
MGTHEGTSERPHTGRVSRRVEADPTTTFGPGSSRTFALGNWPVSWRLFGVIALTLVMGLILGGLRVAAAADSAAQFSRVSQLASLGQQVTVLVQDLENERDETCGKIAVSMATLEPWYKATDGAAATVQSLAAGINGSFPTLIQQKVATVRAAIAGLDKLRETAQNTTFALGVISDYEVPINDMISLNNLIAQGSDDADLTDQVEALNALSMEKDEVSQQRALLYNALSTGSFATAEFQTLSTAAALQGADVTAFDTTATTAEQNAFSSGVTGPQVTEAGSLEQDVLDTGSLDLRVMSISPQAAPALWYSAMSSTISKTQAVERQVAAGIVTRAQSLQAGAERSAVFLAVLIAVILVFVLVATLAVARSLVRPLRRLRAGALDVAIRELPERVHQLGESPETAASLDVAPIDVLSVDEIGQVARAFDQVHSEAVRLAGNEALLRRSFNAMFVSLSRRSQSLIERLARTIDSLELNEEDPDRLSSLFTMDHLVTRMRRNSENLLLLAGHESPRKWSEPVSLTDVTRAATAEIEQYGRVTLNIQPGVVVYGEAVSDVVHLLAELIENATAYSPKDTHVLVAAQELSSGGVLIQVSDSGVGISEARLLEINQRLEEPPVVDESVSRHMGLFAVARLAERHGVRVRLRAGNPSGLTALVWLPDNLIGRETAGFRGLPQVGPNAAPANNRQSNRLVAAPVGAGGGPVTGGPAGPGPAPGGPPGPARPAAGGPDGPRSSSAWFRNRRAAGAPAEASEPPIASGWAEGMQAAQAATNPVRGDHTVAGMPVRVPRANYVPGSADGGEPGRGGAVGRPGGHGGGQHVASRSARRQRTPEMARNRLGGFQRGTRRADGQAPQAGGEPTVDRPI